MPENRSRWKELEVASRRSKGDGRHPDECPKLTLHGVEWAIPPRGAQIVPTFSDDGVEIVCSSEEDWPEAEKVISLVPMKERSFCPQCKQPTSVELEVDLDSNNDFLKACFGLAGKLLDKQYTLTPEQKGELLALNADDVPEWILELLRWCHGTKAPDPYDLPGMNFSQPEYHQPPPPGPDIDPFPKRTWWKFWKHG